MHSAGVRCFESSGGDWLPGDVALGLCARRSGLRSVCQQRKAGGNRPQGQSKGYAVWIVFFFKHIILPTHDRSNPKPSSDISLTNSFFILTPPTTSTLLSPNTHKLWSSSNFFFFLGSQEKEEFAVAKQHSFVLFQHPALCVTAQLLVVIWVQRLQN